MRRDVFFSSVTSYIYFLQIYWLIASLLLRCLSPVSTLTSAVTVCSIQLYGLWSTLWLGSVLNVFSMSYEKATFIW